MPAPEFLTLDNAEQIVIAPLFIINAAYCSMRVQFTVSGFDLDSREVRFLCCYHPEPERSMQVRPTRPLLFEIQGQIARDDCKLTIRGHEEVDGMVDDPLVSFWVEGRPRGDHISRIYWEQALPAMRRIADSIPWEVDLSEVVSEPSEDGSVRFQMKWQPPYGETICSSLPMYDHTGKRIVPTSLSEVPFDQAVRVGFSLEYSYAYTDPSERPRILHAILDHISIM
ncbi:hypothetical protein C8T65DRAFT_581856 [Cerioporus squamosus]|nr:hypothetical protein C8T65DRAFT_581856 [Cerioporus squamosus]